MSRVMLYVRQSDSSGAGLESLSIESQEASLRSYAESQGWTVIGIEREADLKGWMPASKRPGLQRILDMGMAHRFDILLVYSGSRFARDLILQEQWIEQLEAAGVRVMSVTEPWFEDKLVRRLIGAVNEQYTRERSAHSLRSVRTRVESRGLWHGVVPLGYQRTGPADPLAPGPEEDRRTVELIFRLYAEGRNVEDIQAILEERGIPSPGGKMTWYWTSVNKILRNPAYRGIAHLRDIRYENAHPVFLESSLIAAVDDRIAGIDRKRRSPRRKRQGSWLEGLVTHACGEPAYLICVNGTKPRFRCKTAYHCPVGNRHRQAFMLEADARTLLADAFRKLPDADTVIERGKARITQVDRENRERRDRAMAKREAAQRKLERTAHLMVDMDLDESWYQARRAEALAERDAADRELAAIPKPFDEIALREALDTVNAMSHADIIEQTTDTDALRRILRAVGRIEYGPEGTRLVFTDPFAAVFEPQRLRVVPGAVVDDRQTG